MRIRAITQQGMHLLAVRRHINLTIFIIIIIASAGSAAYQYFNNLIIILSLYEPLLLVYCMPPRRLAKPHPHPPQLCATLAFAKPIASHPQ